MKATKTKFQPGAKIISTIITKNNNISPNNANMNNISIISV